MYYVFIKRAAIGMAIILSAGIIYLGFSTNFSNLRRVSAQINKVETENRKIENSVVNRENMISRNLSALLSNKEVSLDETKMLPNRVESSKTIRVSFKPLDRSAGESKFSEQKPAANLLKQSELKVSDQPLMRQRGFELSPTQILIVSVDGEKQVLWWSLQPDPRVFRAETSDDAGNLSGKTIYLNDADMLVSFPAAKEINELYFYSPIWNGKTFDLELIGSLNLRGQGQAE